jgi:hypothetical protein
VLGIGGGGDVVGALATARLCQQLGTRPVLGGIAWERQPIDPDPGPRRLSELVDAEPLADAVALAGPDTRTATGAVFAEARVSRLRAEQTLLIDVNPGPAAIAASLAEAAARLGARAVVCIDVGGDVLGNGSEPGLASPLCDAVMLAAATLLARRGVPTVGAVFGPCCDGELTIDELLDRLAALTGAGALLGAWGMTPEVADELEKAVEAVPTEASAQAVRCARGEVGWATIRRGRRRVPLSPFGALTFYFDPAIAVETVAPLARAVMDATDLENANELLHRLGVRTELDFERSAPTASSA